MIRISRKYLLLILLIISLFAHGQDKHVVDSLLTALSKSTDDKKTCNIYDHIFEIFVRSDLEKASAYNDQYLKLARKINYSKGITNALYNRSDLFRVKGQYDSALAVLMTIKPVVAASSDSIGMADCLSEIGSLYAVKNDLKNALINLHEARILYAKTGSAKNLSLLYNHFGSLFKNQKQYDSSLYYYKKSLEINERTGFKLGVSANLTNIGTMFEEKGDHKMALTYYLKSLAIKETLGDKQGIVKCLNNLGMVNMNLGNVRDAIAYHERGLALALEYKGNLDIAMCYINLGFDYQRGAMYSKAAIYALQGLQVARQINDLKLIRESARVIYQSYDVLKNYEQAYRYHILYEKYSDSIVKLNNLKELAEIQAKYHSATEENQIAVLKMEKDRQELQIQRLRAWYFLAIGLFIALLALSLFFYYRSRISRKLSMKLHEINEMKSHFFANLSHEFRTPLTLMLGPAEKLLESARPEDKPWLQLIHRNASRLLFLDEQLLEFTRIDSGNQKLHLYSGNILLPVTAIAESFVLLAEQKNLVYSFRVPETPVNALFDPDILEKVVTNLLSNAFKYTPSPGNVELRVTTGPLPPAPGVPGGAKEQGSWVRIDVKDSGIGIPLNKKEDIFERFYQLNYNPGNTTGGVGIGLALTRELLNLHHGLITLETTEGKGSLFSVFLPLDSAVFPPEEVKEAVLYSPPRHPGGVAAMTEELPAEAIFDQDPPAIPSEGKLPQVLVVDDNPDMRLYIREILQHHYSVTEAENGVSGFDDACSAVPDLIVTDVMMHPINGIEFCRKIKQDERTSHIPVIMLTALTGAREKIEGLETGADDYLTKPFSTAELRVRILNLINQRRRLRQLFSSTVNLDPKSISVTSADEKFLNRLITLVENNIDNPELDIEFLLRNIAMSRSQLHRKITALTNQPITGFIRIIRIKRAAQLMEQRFGNISEIMYAVGFNNLSYFTKCFREVYHMTPSEFMAR
ncbi:MAG: response regulator [Bacteroidota bacterium]